MDDRFPTNPSEDPATAASSDAATGEAAPGGAADAGAEADVLRAELSRLVEALAAAQAEAADAADRALRLRADLENLRRRAVADQERARAAGLDGAIAPVLTVHDDLERALEAARRSEPGAIVPGVEGVLAGLLRQLDLLGLTRFGAPGERFDAALHEALTAVPAPDPETAGTIHSVVAAGFRQGDRLVRPARVVVYQP